MLSPHGNDDESLADSRKRAADSDSGSAPPKKRGRGRPPGAKNKISQHGPFLQPFVLHLAPGDDVCVKLRQFADRQHCNVVVSSASGTLQGATLQQHDSPKRFEPPRTTPHEGPLTIVSLSGSVLLGEGDPDPPAHAKHTFRLSGAFALRSGSVVGGDIAEGSVARALTDVTIVAAFWGRRPKPTTSATPPPAAARQVGGAMHPDNNMFAGVSVPEAVLQVLHANMSMGMGASADASTSQLLESSQAGLYASMAQPAMNLDPNDALSMMLPPELRKHLLPPSTAAAPAVPLPPPAANIPLPESSAPASGAPTTYMQVPMPPPDTSAGAAHRSLDS